MGHGQRLSIDIAALRQAAQLLEIGEVSRVLHWLRWLTSDDRIGAAAARRQLYKDMVSAQQSGDSARAAALYDRYRLLGDVLDDI